MPTISQFFGIVIRMFFDDHAPPHFHVEYNEYKAVIRLEPLALVEGKLPPRALGMVMEWADQHRPELLDAWSHCAAKQTPNKIAPLE